MGVSLGVERLFAVLEQKIHAANRKVRTTEVDAYVCTAQKNLVDERLKLCNQLWENNFKVEFPSLKLEKNCEWRLKGRVIFQVEYSYKKNPKLLAQLQYCEENSIPFAIILGESEIKSGVVKLRNVVSREETEVQRSALADELRRRLGELNLNGTVPV